MLSILKFFYALAITTVSASEARDELIVAVPNPILSVDPTRVRIAQERFLVPLIFESLFKVDEDGAISSVLADSWSFDKQKHELSIHLRNDHRFSDGSLVTATDVIRTFSALCSAESHARDVLDDLEGCNPKAAMPLGLFKGKDDYTVLFKIKYQPTSFLYRSASYPVSIFKDAKNGLIGSGPYKVASAKASSFELTPNTFHDGLPSAAKHAHLTFRYVAETEIEATLRAEKVDVATMYLSSTAHQFNAPNYTLIYHAPTVTQALVLNPYRKPFNNKALRKMLQKDLAEFARLDQCATGSTRAVGFLPPGIGGSLTTAPSFKLAPEGSGKQQYEITVYEHLGRKSKCEEEHLVKAFANVGVKAQFTYLDSYKDMSPRMGAKNTDAYVELFVFPSRDASTSLRRFALGTPEPLFFYTDSQFSKLLEEAKSRQNLNDRFAIYRKINARIYDDASVLPLYYIGHTIFLKKCLATGLDLGNLPLSPDSFSYLEKMTRSGTSCS